MGSSGLKLFQIDLPADPENYYLRHFCVESDEVLNMCRGNVILDDNGEAIVTMPQCFHDVNINFSYVLTPIGGPAQLYIKEKITGENFSIAGGLPNQEVSRVVYAERNDPYLQQYPERKQNLVAKIERDKGTLQMPQLYGADDEKTTFKSPVRHGQVEVKVQPNK
ncbi:MAG: hypothetical protein ACI9RU_003001 [Litorivivens sp.]|jgi:hypothetical protein